MLSLSQLVKIKKDIVNRFDTINLTGPVNDICNTLESINREYGSHQFVKEKIIQAIDDYRLIEDQSNLKTKELYSIVDTIDIAIKQESVKINQSNRYKLTFDGISNRVFHVDQKVNSIIEASIAKYVDFHYPGLRLGCRYVGQLSADFEISYELSEYYSNCLATCDPLYFSDLDDNAIKTATQHFNEIYLRRIRIYSLDNLDQLPQGQFGFVFSWMLLNYADEGTIFLYLNKIYSLLRPGGTIMFSYNNIDLEESAKIAELGLMSAISKQELFKGITDIGFRIGNSYDLPNEDPAIQMISWVELQKPGNLQTVKIKQVLGQISAK